mgnify:CR=1 FL=1
MNGKTALTWPLIGRVIVYADLAPAEVGYLHRVLAIDDQASCSIYWQELFLASTVSRASTVKSLLAYSSFTYASEVPTHLEIRYVASMDKFTD